MNVLGLDMATKCGWAVALAGRTATEPTRIESGVETFALKRGETAGIRFLRFSRFLTDLVDRYEPKLVIYERAGGWLGEAAAEIAIGFATRVMEMSQTRGFEAAAVHGSTLKKWATGKGNAKKPAMMAAAKAKFPYIELIDDNHADALLVLAYGVATYA